MLSKVRTLLVIGEDHSEIAGLYSFDNGDDTKPYGYEKCYDKRIRHNQNDEAPMCTPFILNDGTKAYSAKVSEIDWEKVHLGEYAINKAVWEICMGKRKPDNSDEATISAMFKNRVGYFSLFKTSDEFARHNSAFWTYGVATNDSYFCCEEGNERDWVSGFFDRFIKPLPPDETVSLYEIVLNA